MKYRRLYVPGGMYFFTLVTEKRRPLLVENIDILRDAFRRAMKNHPFSIEAIVVLPDHLHTIWKLPPDDSDFSMRWLAIKKHFSFNLNAFPVSESKKKKREKGIWQRRYWEHLIRDENDLQRHYDYIHYNPVKHGLESNPIDWEYSSFKKCIQQGLYPPDWGCTEPSTIKEMSIE
ncbi:transposase [bacterium]|nr:transposase [bacterium]